MHNPKQVVKKLITGAILMTAAIFISVMIRENMDVKDPEQALPTFGIVVNGELRLNESTIFRAGYEWNFLTTVAKDTPAYTSESIRQKIYPVEVPPNSVLELEFSMQPKSMRLQRASDPQLEHFVELADVSDGQLIAPSSPGLYLYQVESSFGWRGSIRYFFLVRVQELA